MKIRELGLAFAMVAAATSGCIVNVSAKNAYEGCSTGDTCAGGTVCTTASFTATGGVGALCTTTCTVGSVCPNYYTNSAYLPTCVVNGSTGIGQCYDTCATNIDCQAGTQCAMIAGTPSRICVPIGTGTGPTATAAYAACAPGGSVCTTGSTCQNALFMRAGVSSGYLCTATCTPGVDSTCPGWVAGAVTCVAPQGASVGQCMRTCNAEADCAGYATHCAQAATATRTLNICIP